jgi:NTP pyrophosphatase (non-canonical NTP hydrolase)
VRWRPPSEISEFQQSAYGTSYLRSGGPQGLLAPLLGLASETGSILDVYKKYVRDGIDLAASREFLSEEIGDLLWYAAVVATACGLDLEVVAQKNLERPRDRYGDHAGGRDLHRLPLYDASLPEQERF